MTTGIGRHEERSTARIIGTVYPVTCAISSSVSPARCAIIDRVGETELRRRVGGRRLEQFLAMLVVHRGSLGRGRAAHILRTPHRPSRGKSGYEASAGMAQPYPVRTLSYPGVPMREQLDKLGVTGSSPVPPTSKKPPRTRGF